MASVNRSLHRLPAFIVVLTAAPSCPTPDYWEGSHSTGTGIVADRPECPQVWRSIPVLRTPSRSDVNASGVQQYVVPSTGLPVPGPITDVAEFHDCQRFIDRSGTKFESLYAIFASSRLDSIGASFASDAVEWTSSNSAVATVVAGHGVVTGIAPGTVAIKATSIPNPSWTATIMVTVNGLPGPIPATVDTVSLASAVVASPSIRVGQYLVLKSAIAKSTISAVPAAQVYTYGPGYKELGIGPNFSCLYLYYDMQHKLAAQMVPVPETVPLGKECAAAVNPNTTSGRRLIVTQRVGGTDADYPAVARWDYDTVNKQYYVGIKCGAAWCEIGANGAQPFTPSSPMPVPESSTAAERRVIAIKGWHDQQNLAMDNSGGEAIPSGIVAEVIPTPDLEKQARPQYHKTWLLTGYVYLDTTRARPGAVKSYKDKYNFDYTPPGLPLRRLNRIFHCFGTREDCKVPEPGLNKGCDDMYKGVALEKMWVKHESTLGGKPSYRCGIRRQHPITTPLLSAATARWRWVALDETIWEFCAAMGCCETGGNKISEAW